MADYTPTTKYQNNLIESPKVQAPKPVVKKKAPAKKKTASKKGKK